MAGDLCFTRQKHEIIEKAFHTTAVSSTVEWLPMHATLRMKMFYLLIDSVL